MELTLKQLKYILVVAEEKSISKAAKKLFISQPSLSQIIIRAEQELGVQLFDRDKKPFAPTYAGCLVVEMAKKYFSMEMRLFRELSDIENEQAGRLVIGASPTRGARVIPPIFAAFHAEYPKVELILKEERSSQLLDLLDAGEVDLAFVGHTTTETDSVCLLKDRLMLVIPKPCPYSIPLLDGQTEISLQHFSDVPFILLHKGQALRNLSDKVFETYRLHPKTAYETGYFNVAYNMVIHGLGCTFAPETLRNTSSKVQFFAPDRGEYPYSLFLAWKKGQYLNSPTKRFIQLAKSCLQQQSFGYPHHIEDSIVAGGHVEKE